MLCYPVSSYAITYFPPLGGKAKKYRSEYFSPFRPLIITKCIFRLTAISDSRPAKSRNRETVPVPMFGRKCEVIRTLCCGRQYVFRRLFGLHRGESVGLKPTLPSYFSVFQGTTMKGGKCVHLRPSLMNRRKSKVNPSKEKSRVIPEMIPPNVISLVSIWSTVSET